MDRGRLRRAGARRHPPALPVVAAPGRSSRSPRSPALGRPEPRRAPHVSPCRCGPATPGGSAPRPARPRRRCGRGHRPRAEGAARRGGTRLRTAPLAAREGNERKRPCPLACAAGAARPPSQTLVAGARDPGAPRAGGRLGFGGLCPRRRPPPDRDLHLRRGGMAGRLARAPLPPRAGTGAPSLLAPARRGLDARQPGAGRLLGRPCRRSVGRRGRRAALARRCGGPSGHVLRPAFGRPHRRAGRAPAARIRRRRRGHAGGPRAVRRRAPPLLPGVRAAARALHRPPRRARPQPRRPRPDFGILSVDRAPRPCDPGGAAGRAEGICLRRAAVPAGRSAVLAAGRRSRTGAGARAGPPGKPFRQGGAQPRGRPRPDAAHAGDCAGRGAPDAPGLRAPPPHVGPCL